MSSSVVNAASKRLTESQRAALVNLLGDDDPAVYQKVRETIVSQGPDVAEWLRPHLLSRDHLLRRRSREIIQHFERHNSDTRFLMFCLKHGEDFDLEEAAWMLARTAHPDINVEAYRALLDTYATELRDRIAPDSSGAHTLARLNEYLFDELEFEGNEEDYYDPENSYLNCVLDRRTGNAINLCLVYLLLGRRLRLPLTGIGMPGHFICRYQSAADEIYVDVFHRGKLLSKADCVQYLQNGNYGFREDLLSPVSARRIMTRICTNLHQIYLQLKLGEETTRMQRYLVALAR